MADSESTVRPKKMQPLEIALKYIEQGWSPIPIPYKKKGPNTPGWQRLRITKEDAWQYFSEDEEQNIGVILGEASNGLVDIDLDCVEALALVGLFPQTGAGFGRASTPNSHLLYICPDIKKTKKYVDPSVPKSEATMLEIRAGGQTVFPGSTHPSGELVTWSPWCKGGDIVTISGEQLKKICAHIAAACLLGKYWPEGSRHDCTLALAGGILVNNSRISVDNVCAFIEAVCLVAGDPEVDDRLAAVRSTAERVEAGETDVVGWPTLKEIIGIEKVVDTAAVWLDAKMSPVRTDVVEMFGAPDEHAEIDTAERSFKYVYIRALDKFHEQHSNLLISRQQMDAMMPAADKKDRERWTEAFFRDHREPGSTEFKSFTYMPGEPWCSGDQLNLWTGPKIEPIDGEVTPWLWLMEKLFPDIDERHHITQWMAYTVQHPGVKINHSLLVVGPTPGQGKDTVFEPLVHALGEHNCGMVFADSLTNQYNAFLRNKKLLIVQEIQDFMDKGKVSNYLKPMLASPPFNIEVREKYVGHYEVPNIVHWLFFSNEESSMRIMFGDRRYYPVRVEAGPLGAAAGGIWAWYKKQNGFAKVAQYLLDFDVSDFDPTAAPPTTRYKEELMELSRPDLDSQILEIMEHGGPAEWSVFTLSKLKFILPDTYSSKRLAIALRRLGAKTASVKMGTQNHRYWYKCDVKPDREAILKYLGIVEI